MSSQEKDTNDTASTSSKEQLLVQGSKFLDAEEIRNAPLDKKREFLLSKGLSSNDIDSILNSQPEIASSSPSRPPPPTSAAAPTAIPENKTKTEEKNPLSNSPELKEVRLRPPSLQRETTGFDTTSPEQIKPIQHLLANDYPTSIPPIVTYPEFLTPQPTPPAPVNAQNLVKGLYLAGGLAATIYGASKYYFQPMYDSLTAARLDLHSTALTNLTTFNEKLSTLVPNKKKSFIKRPGSPITAVGGVSSSSSGKRYHSDATNDANERRKSLTKQDRGEENEDDDDDNDDDTSSQTSNSSDSDSEPTELFHTDVGTQTSPPPSDISPEDAAEINSPEAKLEKISNHLSTLVTSNSDGTDNELMFELESLSTYLDGLNYDRFGSSLGEFYAPYTTFPGAIGSQNKDDPVAKVKAEIRSVKGVFLNTKNFPMGGLR